MLKTLLSLQKEALKEARLVLERGVYFYVFMISLIFAYILEKIDTLGERWISITFLFLLVTTVFVFISVSLLCFGLYKGLLDTQKTIKYLYPHKKIFNHVDEFIQRGIKIAAVIGILGCVFMLFVLSIIIVSYIQWRGV